MLLSEIFYKSKIKIMNKSALLIILGIFVFAGGLIFSFDRKENFSQNKDYSYNIQSKWELPDILDEVSGIEWIGENRIACVQDEDGIIFIYNLETREIEQEIDFAGSGDYEGLAINENIAYVVRSDGTIFEILNFRGNNPKTQKFETFLTEAQNVEGLCLDRSNNRLMLTIKDKERESDDYKGVYAFNLQNKELAKKPVFKLDMKDKLLEKSGKKLSRKFRTSEIEIHPKTGEIYFLDAKIPKLVITDKLGKFKRIYALDKDEFNQPEGLTFNPDGSLYISNEAGSGPGNIIEVKLKN